MFFFLGKPLMLHVKLTVHLNVIFNIFIYFCNKIKHVFDFEVSVSHTVILVYPS